MLAAPGLFFPMVGVERDPDGLLMARVSGSGLLNFELMCYLVRNGGGTSVGLRAILIGNMVFHALDAFSTFIASSSGVMNTLGWLFCGLHFVLALGFLYFLLRSGKKNTIPQPQHQFKIIYISFATCYIALPK